MSHTNNRNRPAFRGLNWHKTKHFSFFRPIDWYQFDWLDDRQGILFGPTPDDNATLFGIDIKDIGVSVTKDDLEDLLTGLLSGIKQLPDSQIESQEGWVAGVVTGVEAKYTFREKETVRKRWVRVLYQDGRQITVTAQGATVEDYDYWLPMFYESMMTFKVHANDSEVKVPNKTDSSFEL